MPELWNCKNESYKNRNMRNKSYNKLLTEYKKVKSDGTIEELKKKIANMRTCYRRELKKCIKSEKSGAGADDIYVSNLWYYDAFNFLRDLEMPLPGRSTLSSDEEENGLVTSEKKQVPKKSAATNARMDFLRKATEHLESTSKIDRIEDEATVYANGWAVMYRKISAHQQLFAKRAIDEILMLGRLNKLSFDTVNRASLISTPALPRTSTPYAIRTTPVGFEDNTRHIIPTSIFANGTESYDCESKQIGPRTIISSGTQCYDNIMVEDAKDSGSYSYENFSELLSDSQ